MRLLLVKERVMSGDFDVKDQHGGGNEKILEDSKF